MNTLRILGVMVTIGFLSACSFHWPSDKSTIALLKEHHADFEKIIEMVREDKSRGWIPVYGARIDPSWGSPDGPDTRTKDMPVQRFKEYTVLFSKLGLRYGLTVGDAEDVYFDIDCYGWVSSGSYKGLAYKPSIRGAKIVESTEHQEGGFPSGRYLRPVERDWFVYRTECD